MERLTKSTSDWHCLARPKRERLMLRRMNIQKTEASLPQLLMSDFDKKRAEKKPTLIELKS